MAERKQERVYSAEEAAERLKRELPHWYFEDGWIRRLTRPAAGRVR